jgi:hypothetical protein
VSHREKDEIMIRTYVYDDDNRKRKFAQQIRITGQDGGDFEWLRSVLERSPVLYSLAIEVLEQIRTRYPGELKKESGQYSHEYRNQPDNFWTVEALPFGTFKAAHNQEPPRPALKFSLYGGTAQDDIKDTLEIMPPKLPGAFGSSYRELKVYSAAEMPELMARIELAHKLKTGQRSARGLRRA